MLSFFCIKKLNWFFLETVIPKSLEESEIWQGAAMNLSQAKPTPKQLNLNALSDVGGSQIH